MMDLKSDYTLFQSEILTRGIKYLIHFTTTLNLRSILECGKLIPRETIESMADEKIDFLDYIQLTDKNRLDGKQFINLSISRINTYLFERFQERTRENASVNWCILRINPIYIYAKETKFSIANAASNESKQFGITGDFEKFKSLFADHLPIKYGVRPEGMDPMFPTSVQAEVLVREEIPTESILEVCFDSPESLAAAKAALSEFDTSNFVVDANAFH